MHEYDIALKSFLRQGRESLFALTAVTIDRWHNVELPEVRNRRVDMLGETAEGGLVHIELQSTNDASMALRMMEYCSAVYRQFDRFPEQVVLYVGEAPLRMTGAIRGPHVSFDCRIADIRDLDGECLLESDRIGDNILAVLARVRDQRDAVRRILGRIAAGDPAERADALAGFLILAALRKLAEVVEREVRQMPLLNDIMDHPVLGREFRRGMEQGLHDGELILLLRQIERRFGSVPARLRERLTALSGPEIEEVAFRLLDARNVDELLR